ncbi:hypothetical protein D3C75_884890 [compost metagenome]
MNIHLVFEASLLQALKPALQENGYTVSGVDMTLEQFRIAAEAGNIEADIVLVDGSLGIRRQESVQLLKETQLYAPELRLIVILSTDDVGWVRELGLLGIYDVLL